MFIFIVLFLFRRSTSSSTQSVQNSTTILWTNTSDKEALSTDLPTSATVDFSLGYSLPGEVRTYQ